jgi:hypothetical protein
MSQIFTLDHRQSNPRHDLETNADELRAPARGDFARGQRHGIGRAHTACDFATGMRTSSMQSVTGDFATGMRTSHRRLTLADFATGMRTTAAPVVVDTFTSLDTTLAAAA